jgi:hypothetical protein
VALLTTLCYPGLPLVERKVPSSPVTSAWAEWPGLTEVPLLAG